MKHCKKLAIMALTMMPAIAWAQKSIESNIEADVVSRYVWRGQDRGGFSVQPEASVSWQGLSLSAWGNIGLDKDDAREIDLTLGYERWGFNVGITDYWETGVDEQDRWLHFEKKGAHQLEANLGYTCKYGSLQAYTIFWGNDFKIDGKQAYSTYIELSVPFRLGSVDWIAKAGITPMESAGYTTPKTIATIWGEATVQVPHHYYAEGFACNVTSLRATKAVTIGSLELPLYGELCYNPYMNTAYMFFGATIRPF